MSRDAAVDAIENTVTDEDVSLVAQRYTSDKKVRVLNYHIDAFPEGRLGYLGSHRNLKVTLQRSNASKPETASFFVKSMPYDCEEQVDLMNADGIFVKETNFFNSIAPLFGNHCESEKWHCKCYLAKEDAMIMEDLKCQGYATLVKKFDDAVLIKSVLATLARFHACSILAEHKLNHNSKTPLTLDEHYPGYFDEKLFARDSKFFPWISAGADVACLLANNFGYDPDKIRKAHDEVYRMMGPSKTHRNVVGHGDLHESNIMFVDDSPLQKCLLVDFQLVRYGPLVLDLLHFLHLKATGAYREKHERDLLKHYHSVMKETIENNDPAGIVKTPTLEEILSAMDDLRIFGLVVAVQYFPIILMDRAVAGEYTKDSDSYNHFVFVDRTQAVVDHMKTNESYEKHVKRAVVELAEKCDLLWP